MLEVCRRSYCFEVLVIESLDFVQGLFESVCVVELRVVVYVDLFDLVLELLKLLSALQYLLNFLFWLLVVHN